MLGTDPEFFILNKEGKSVPAWDFFPSKHDAEVIRGHGKFFRDGYALEVNTPAHHCRTMLAQSVWSLLQSAQLRLPVGYTFTTKAAVEIDPSVVADAPMDCQIFGCDPSLSAYSDEPVRPELDAASHNYRYAGGHMHISLPQGQLLSDEDKKLLIKAYDLFIGLPLAYIYDDEANRQRRQYYGQAGEYRIQVYPPTEQEVARATLNRLRAPEPSYGLEYRVPSPQVWNTNKISNLFFGVLRSIPNCLKDIKPIWKPSWEGDIREQINNCDVSYSWLQKVVGHYTPALLKKVKDAKAFQECLISTTRGYPQEDDGWAEWVIEHFPKNCNRLLGLEAGVSRNQAKYGDFHAAALIRERLLKAA